MTLLSMINSVRGKIREERIASISATDYLTTEIIDLINDAGFEILDGNEWSFDVRHDGKLFFPEPITDGATSLYYNDFTTTQTTVTLDVQASGGFGATGGNHDKNGIRFTEPRTTRWIPTGDVSTTDTSWVVTDISRDLFGTSWTLTLTNEVYMDTIPTPATWELYSNEQVLPSTVKDVLSIQSEEQNIALEFVDRTLAFDSVVPRMKSSSSDYPYVAFVGSTLTGTSRSGTWNACGTASATTGTGVMVWPPQNQDIHLNYSYRVQHTEMSSASDTWDGVPTDVLNAIEWRAVGMCYESGIKNDPIRARQIERQVEKRVLRALMRDGAQPNIRRIPGYYGLGSRYENYRSRWASQTITAP